MIRDIIEDLGWSGILWLLLFVLIIAGPFVVAIKVSSIERQCLAAGYPNVRTTWGGFGTNQYCIKRLDQTDVVVPLREVIK